MEKQGLPEPEYEVAGGFVRIVFRRPEGAGDVNGDVNGQAGHNGEAVTVGSHQTLHSSPWRSFRSRFSVCQPCKFNPSQPPKGGAITPGLRRCFESPSVPESAS